MGLFSFFLQFFLRLVHGYWDGSCSMFFFLFAEGTQADFHGKKRN